MSLPLVYLDACFFVIAFETTGTNADRAKLLVRRLLAKPDVATTSELIIAELLAPVQRPQIMSVEGRRELYLYLFDTLRFITLAPITRSILLETVLIRQTSPQRIADAIHVATAVETGCRFFVSFDRDARRLPAGLTWVTPINAGFDALLQALDA